MCYLNLRKILWFIYLIYSLFGINMFIIFIYLVSFIYNDYFMRIFCGIPLFFNNFYTFFFEIKKIFFTFVLKFSFITRSNSLFISGPCNAGCFILNAFLSMLPAVD